MELNKKKISELREEYIKKKGEIEKRLDGFSKVSEEEYFYELVFCLLTPQSSAKRCWEAVELLRKDDFFNRDFYPKKYLRKIRFYNNKSNYLIRLRKDYKNVLKKIISGEDSGELREYLVSNIKGMGYKEASHFLRNIGCRNFAILDRHIFKNLREYDAIEDIPKSLTKKKYIFIERRFKEFSEKVGIPMDHLDLLFWSMETGEVFK